jgi:putative membrane protein
LEEFPHGIALAWSFPPLPAVLILLTAAIYLRGWRKLQLTRARELPPWRAASFLIGLLALWIALASPIDALDDFLLSAHMIQHFILMSVAPPLLVLGAPIVPMLRGLPRPLIRALRPLFAFRPLHLLAHTVTKPIVAWLLMNIAYLGWHTPAAFDLTLRSEFWHTTEHLTFLLTNILFWWVVIVPWPSRPRGSQWIVIPYLVSADLVNTALSAVLVWSGRVLYAPYAQAERIFHLTALQDQILAGSEMWVLNSIVFLVPVAVVIVQLLSPRSLRSQTAVISRPARS